MTKWHIRVRRTFGSNTEVRPSSNSLVKQEERQEEQAERQKGSPSSEVMLNSFLHLEINSVHPVLHDKLVHIVPDEPSRVYPILQFSYEWILLHAKKYIWLQTPYFVPTEPVLHAIKAAALMWCRRAPDAPQRGPTTYSCAQPTRPITRKPSMPV
jgi:phosphatidylserine/phosphatidylglycerophosphate/cardiolipin synthase-like enzyme